MHLSRSTKCTASARFSMSASMTPRSFRSQPRQNSVISQSIPTATVTGKLAALHFYQLSLPSIQPRPGIDFDVAAAARGDELFSGKANCNSCHHEPLWTEPGWNQHSAEEMKIDSFEADRS